MRRQTGNEKTIVRGNISEVQEEAAAAVHAHIWTQASLNTMLLDKHSQDCVPT